MGNENDRFLYVDGEPIPGEYDFNSSDAKDERDKQNQKSQKSRDARWQHAADTRPLHHKDSLNRA